MSPGRQRAEGPASRPDPGLERLEAGLLVLRPPMPGPLGWTNSYLAQAGDGRWSVLDPGFDWPPARRLWEEAARALGWTAGVLEQVVVTHFHPDHLGLAGWLVERWGGRVLAHARELPLIRQASTTSSSRLAGASRRLRRHLVENGIPEEAVDGLMAANAFLAKPSHPISHLEPLHDGAAFRFGPHPAVALWTPGHTAGHLVVHLPEPGFLLSGDHVLGGITPNISLWPSGSVEPLEEYLGSLERLERLRVRRVLPAHRSSLEDLAGRLRELQAHHRRRLELCRRLVEGRPATAYELLPQLFSPDLAEEQQLFALGETLAHLRWLQRHGRVRLLPGSPARYVAR